MAKIDVVMSVYNGSQFIRPALESLNYQTFSDWRLILVDDGSTDGSISIAEEIIAKKKLQIISFSKNKGLSYALNSGLKQVNSEYVARFDADDINLPNRFQNQIDCMQKFSKINAISSPILGINKNGKKRSIHSWRDMDTHEVNLLLPFINLINHPTTFFRAKDFVRLQYRHKKAEDYFMWLENFEELNWKILKFPCLKWRQHNHNLSRFGYNYDQDFLNLRRASISKLGLNLSEDSLLLINGNSKINSKSDILDIKSIKSEILRFSQSRSFIRQANIAFDSFLLRSLTSTPHLKKFEIVRSLSSSTFSRLAITSLKRITQW
jgi:glycosyltransferase involved in cell wall biosynthesis